MEEGESDRRRKNKKSKNLGMNIKEDEVWKRKTKKWNEVQMRTKEKNRRKNSTEEAETS